MPARLIAAVLKAARREVAAVAALCGLAAGLVLFARLAEEVSENETHGFDMAVLSALRTPGAPNDPIGPHWLEAMTRDLTSLGSTTVLIFLSLVVIGFLLLHGRRAAALVVLASCGGGTALSNGFKAIFQRARPEADFRAIEVGQTSFPSGHALISAVAYLTLGAILARELQDRRSKLYVQGLAVFLVLVIGLSRVYLGVHWMTDVLAGWCLGAAWATLLWLLVWWVERRGRLASDGLDP